MSRILEKIDDLIDDREFDRECCVGSRVKQCRDYEIRGIKKVRKLIKRDALKLESVADAVFDNLLYVSEPVKFKDEYEPFYKNEKERQGQIALLRSIIIAADLTEEFNEFFEDSVETQAEVRNGKDD